MQLRDICLQSPRLNEVDFAAWKKEIGAIEIHGLEQYFLDIYNAGIKVSNAPNSIVAYVAGLTDEKPQHGVKYKGGTSPDVDMDFAQDSRAMIAEYLRQKYGYDKVANIGTYGVLHTKSAIRYCAKVLGWQQDEISELMNLVPEPPTAEEWDIDQSIDARKELKTRYEKDDRTREVLDMAKTLYGTLGSRGIHAAGVVISKEPIANVAPMWYTKDGAAVLEFDMSESESLGFLKMDLLGLKTLDVCRDVVNLINSRHNLNLTFDDIPIDTPEIYKLLGTGKLLGIFQLEGDAISGFTKGFKPQTVDDVILISAGFRPGPKDFLLEIAKIRNGKRDEVKIEPHGERFPILKKVLEKTYGYFIFQEQIMQTVQFLAGYNDSEADEFRKIISKKIVEKMNKEKDRFQAKALEKGMSQEEIDQLWEEMKDFAKYSFNKSHAAAYTVITNRTAWLKANYPVEFYAINIFYELEDLEEATKYILEAKESGMKILPPDINESDSGFTVVDKTTIRYGLSGIVSVGDSASSPIIEERNNGPYRSFTDFIWRTNTKSNVVHNMILAGCFDTIASRSQLLKVMRTKGETPEYYYDDVISLVKAFKAKNWPQPDLGEELIPLPLLAEYPVSRLIAMEKDVTNLWLTCHPTELYKEEIAGYLAKNKHCYIGLADSIELGKNKRFWNIKLSGDERAYKLAAKSKADKDKKFNPKPFIGELVILQANQWAQNPQIYWVNTIKLLKEEVSSHNDVVNISIPLTYEGFQMIEMMQRQFSDISTVNVKTNKIQARLKGKNFSAELMLGFSDNQPT